MPRRHESPPKHDVDLSKSSELTVGRPAQTRAQLEEGRDQPALVQEAKEHRKKNRVGKPETLRRPSREESQNELDLSRLDLFEAYPEDPAFLRWSVFIAYEGRTSGNQDQRDEEWDQESRLLVRLDRECKGRQRERPKIHYSQPCQCVYVRALGYQTYATWNRSEVGSDGLSAASRPT